MSSLGYLDGYCGILSAAILIALAEVENWWFVDSDT